MTPPRTGTILARAALATTLVTALVAGLLTGCSSKDGYGAQPTSRPSGGASGKATDREAACRHAEDRLLRAVRGYIAQYGAPLSPATKPAGPGADQSSNGQQAPDLQAVLKRTRKTLAAERCDVSKFRHDLADRMSRIRAGGPVARAVLLRLESSLTGTAVQAPQTVTVKPGDDLAEKLAALAAGSTVRLVAGDYRLRRPLVLLAGVSLRGQGQQRTTITSTARGSGVLVLTDGRVELDALTLRHGGHRPASLLVGGPTSSIVLTRVHVTGARSAKSGQAGAGVTMTAADGAEAGRGTTLEVTASRFSGNSAAGVLLSGGHRVSIHRARFAGNGQCGICFVGHSGGVVRGSTFTDNAVGVVVLDRARPVLVSDTFRDGQVAVQATGHGAPVLREASIRGAARAAMIFGERSSGRVDNSTCRAVPYGIVVSPHAYPYLGENSCQLAKGAG